MSRNQSFSPMEVSALAVRLTWASVEIMVDDVEQLQILVAGSDVDCGDLKVELSDGTLLLEQPAIGININLMAGRWMDVFIRMPLKWRGPVELSTRSGRINARGLCGTDIRLESVTGDLRVMNVSGIDCMMHTVSGHLFGGMVDCERLTLRSVASDITMEDVSFRTVKAASVSGSIRLGATRPIEAVDANTVTGHLTISAPVSQIRLSYHSVSGQLRTRGVALQQSGIPISLSSVSGDLEINGLTDDAME